MVAPIDSKVSFEVDGEPITVRLNWRSISLAEDRGIDLLTVNVGALKPAKLAVLVKCLAVQEHPTFTEDDAMSVVYRFPEVLASAITELFANYGGKPEGNVKGRKPEKAPA